MWDPTSTNGNGVMYLICTCSLPYSTRPFENSLASDSIRTPKLSEFGREHSDGWLTGKFSCQFPKTKPWGRGPKRTISCYGGAGLGCDRMVSEPLCRSVRMCRRGRLVPLKWGWIVWSHIDQRRGGDVPYMYILPSLWNKAFWQLTGFEFHRNSEFKRVWVRAFLGWVTHSEVLVWVPINKTVRVWPKADNIVLLRSRTEMWHNITLQYIPCVYWKSYVGNFIVWFCWLIR